MSYTKAKLKGSKKPTSRASKTPRTRSKSTTTERVIDAKWNKGKGKYTLFVVDATGRNAPHFREFFSENGIDHAELATKSGPYKGRVAMKFVVPISKTKSVYSKMGKELSKLPGFAWDAKKFKNHAYQIFTFAEYSISR
jgi:hypothetical protein